MTVAVLFARADSIYKTMAGCDVWDMERDARKWPGGAPIVAHPPCRAWGRLKHMAKPRPGEKKLAPWSVGQIRKWGGVLEHPVGSLLWPACGLPEPGARDRWGGFTIIAPQFWWGHLCEKSSRFYIVGCNPKDLPALPFKLGEAPKTINSSIKKYHNNPAWRPELPKSGREKTPPELASWVVELARRCERR